MSSITCPACGSDCNERDELAKAEREITRLRAEVESLRAELARLTPMMRLEPSGWEFLDWIEPDFLTSIPQGTQLYMIDAARAVQGDKHG